jgi:hypothetical protein
VRHHGVECEVDNLSIRHRAGEVMEPEPAELRDEDYPDQREVDLSAGRGY